MVAINCLRKIYVSGGPQLITVAYQVLNQDTVQVRQVGEDYREIEIVGLEEGKTKVILTVKSGS